jgi:hypothetical protein
MPDATFIDQIEADFFSALERLDRRHPTNNENKAALKAGKLKVSFVSVAREAGHSRTLIGYEGAKCKYPRVRDLILDRIAVRRGQKRVSVVSAITQVRQSKRELETMLAQCQQKMMAAVIEKDDALERRKRDQEEIARLKKLLKANENVVPLTVMKGSD